MRSFAPARARANPECLGSESGWGARSTAPPPGLPHRGLKGAALQEGPAAKPGAAAKSDDKSAAAKTEGANPATTTDAAKSATTDAEKAAKVDDRRPDLAEALQLSGVQRMVFVRTGEMAVQRVDRQAVEAEAESLPLPGLSGQIVVRWDD